ncbi:MAG: peptidylprolyl isomerase [Proteobacteria bacterium]|nr:MAG: peptidylprolyl isomerase [Pseudomonadota bacterium]
MMRMSAFLLAPLLAFTVPALAQDATGPEPTAAPKTELVVIETALGPITVALEVERAPISANNFLRYADEKRLDGTVFYRVMKLNWGEQPNGVIQGGAQWDPKRILPPIAHEPTDVTGVTHKRGAISMARLDPGTATGDFSILLSDIEGFDADPSSTVPELKAGYAAFGYVVSGMEVVEAIYNVPRDPDKGEGYMKGEMIAQPIAITRVRRATPAQ